MNDTVIHYTLEPGQSMASTYCTTLNGPDDDGPGDHPGSFSVRPARTEDLLYVSLYHGRDSEDEDMEDWGYDGPILQCQSLAHDPDRMLLQGADPLSLALAKRLGLQVDQDTIAIAYGRDGVLTVPRFRGEKPAYFGDFSMYI